MAGIGFELRKIFSRKTLVARTWGVIYASAVSVGPTLLFLVLLFAIRFVMHQLRAGEMETLFFTASFTHVFLIAILLSAFLNTVVSRYISDKIFERKEADICASLYGVLTISSVVSGVITLILCAMMHNRKDASITFLIAFYLLTVLASNVYQLITYVSAIKEYRKVTEAYLAGDVAAVGLFLLLFKLAQLPLLAAVFWALAGGFFLINLLLVCVVVRSFGAPSKNYFEFLSYFKKYPQLFFSGAAYMLGFYISNIIYWYFSDMSIKVSIFRIAPNYDMAIFLAMLVNLSSMIIFQVKTETSFYEKYVAYLSQLGKGTYEKLEASRVTLQNTLGLQLFYLYEVQLIITIILICLANVFYPYLGLNNEILNKLLLLGMGVYCIFCMYFTVIFLYYFEDYTGACIATTVFFLIVLLGSCLCCVLGEPFDTIPVLTGGITGWIISFLLLRRRMQKLNAFLLCR